MNTICTLEDIFGKPSVQPLQVEMTDNMLHTNMDGGGIENRESVLLI